VSKIFGALAHKTVLRHFEKQLSFLYSAERSGYILESPLQILLKKSSIQIPDMTEDTVHKQTNKHIRGSGLLLSGRLLSIALNLLTQVLIVRYLSKADYGVWAYTLALISTATTLGCLGMERTVGRFIPIYEEEGKRASVAGTLVLAFATIAALGFATVALVIGFRSLLSDTVIDNPAVISILVVLIALAPVNAFSELLEGVFSAFGEPKIIFLRKHVIGPSLKLAAIILTIAIGSNLHTLAIATVFAGVLGILLYGVLLPKVLREHNLTQYFRPGMFSIEYRRLLRFCMPVFAADMAIALRVVLVILALEHFHNLTNVAEYRAVLPIARLNNVVLVNFSLLFLPLASKLFAQKSTALLGEIQSHVTLWVTVLSYPVFAACISLSEPLTVLLLGERYSSAAPILAILAVGYFFQAALGLNRQSLRALGKVRVLLYIEIAATLIAVITALMLVPTFGAIGAAIATTATVILYSIMNTIAWWRFTGDNPLPWVYARVYLLAAACALGLWLVKPLAGIDSILLSLFLVGITSAIVILSCWKLLRFSEIFPEALRLFRSMKR
jgi:O-antigen/teichoic acid export membrane protein